MADREWPGASTPSGFLPPADFPLFGVRPWPGNLELDATMHIASGGGRHYPPVGFWLAHEEIQGGGGVRVGTFHRQRFEQSCVLGRLPGRHRGRRHHLSAVPDAPGDILAAVARLGTTPLARLTLPNVETVIYDSETGPLFQLAPAHLDAAADRHHEWRWSEWVVDGRPQLARVLRFAGGWTGFIVQSSAYVVAVGVVTEPEGLTLQTLESTNDYGVDLSEPLSVRWRLRRGRRREVSDTILRRPNPYRFHPDHLALIYGD